MSTELTNFWMASHSLNDCFSLLCICMWYLNTHKHIHIDVKKNYMGTHTRTHTHWSIGVCCIEREINLYNYLAKLCSIETVVGHKTTHNTLWRVSTKSALRKYQHETWEKEKCKKNLAHTIAFNTLKASIG